MGIQHNIQFGLSSDVKDQNMPDKRKFWGEFVLRYNQWRILWQWEKITKIEHSTKKKGEGKCVLNSGHAGCIQGWEMKEFSLFSKKEID